MAAPRVVFAVLSGHGEHHPADSATRQTTGDGEAERGTVQAPLRPTCGGWLPLVFERLLRAKDGGFEAGEGGQRTIDDAVVVSVRLEVVVALRLDYRASIRKRRDSPLLRGAKKIFRASNLP